MMTTKQNAMIGLLLSSFPSLHAADAESALTAYELALEGYSDDDVAEGVRAFIQGRVQGHNMAFAPTAPQLAAACRRAMDARLDAANRYKAAVRQIEARDADAEKTPESRARVKAQVNELVAKLTTSENFVGDSAMLERARKRHDSYFQPTLNYTTGDPDADTGDLGMSGAA